ncbi:hypothetical protein H0H87_007665 [Tephrocybe sp. NHM501043]|nr:hypothetical protein H0H87_007665 [Tephrocybe sp. NHM501043]
MNDARLHKIPLVLETPSNEQPETWAKEITMLNSLSGLKLGDRSQGLENSIRVALANSGIELGPTRITKQRHSKARDLAKSKKTSKTKQEASISKTTPKEIWSDIKDEEMFHSSQGPH